MTHEVEGYSIEVTYQENADPLSVQACDHPARPAKVRYHIDTTRRYGNYDGQYALYAGFLESVM